MDILSRIVQSKQYILDAEFEEYKNYRHTSEKRCFYNALKALNPAIIAEIKFASPQKGNFNVKHTLEELVWFYEKGGAAALSVLACAPYFQGSPLNVCRAKEASQLPVLWKDFVFDLRQVEMAKNCGADAILLMCSVIGGQLPVFLEACHEIGIEAVVEVFDDTECELALSSGSKIILINNRNLRTLEVSLEVSKKLVQKIPPDVLIISASGIKERENIDELSNKGLKAFLIGESLATSTRPDLVIQNLTGGDSYESCSE